MFILIINNKFNHLSHFSQCQSSSFSSKTRVTTLMHLNCDCCFDLKCNAELHSETLLIHTPGDFMELDIPLYDQTALQEDL